MIEVSFSDLIENRRADNTRLFCEPIGSPVEEYRLTATTERGLILIARVRADTQDADDLLAMQPFWNKPVPQEEYRFLTHLFQGVNTWNGKTNGDPAAWFVGGAAFVPAVGLWFTAQGAPISATYDDVSYKWFDAQGVEQCYLDLTGDVAGSPYGVWRRTDTNATIVSFDPTSGRWKDTNNVDRTSSRWSIVPYPNTKMRLIKATTQFHENATIQEVAPGVPGALRYIVYRYVTTAEMVGTPLQGYPEGVYAVKQFVYHSPDEVRIGADDKSTNSAGIVHAAYDYRTTTVESLDALKSMRLDISLDGHLPVISSADSYALFEGNKVGSF